MRVFLLAALCLIGPLAERDVGAEPAGPAAAKDADFPAWLARGRKYLQAKQYGPAVVALARAVALRPGDPAALSELGWAAFLANDLAQAETVTAQALQATAVDSELRAATLYNKGRIDEARGRREQALDAYKQSLTIRANTTVRQRLRALDAKAAAEFDPLRLSALRGPMANLKELAKEISSEARVEVGEPLFLTPSAAFRKGRVLTKQHEFLPQSSLALRTAKGWFYVNNFYLEETEGGSHTSASQTSCMYEAAELTGKVSILSCTVMTNNYNRGETFSGCEYRPGEKTVLQLALWCAVGRSGFPSCTEPLPIAELRENYDCQQNAHLEEDWALLPTVNSGGVTLTLSPTRRYGYRDSSHGLLGRHPLRFFE